MTENVGVRVARTLPRIISDSSRLKSFINKLSRPSNPNDYLSHSKSFIGGSSRSSDPDDCLSHLKFFISGLSRPSNPDDYLSHSKSSTGRSSRLSDPDDCLSHSKSSSGRQENGLINGPDFQDTVRPNCKIREPSVGKRRNLSQSERPPDLTLTAILLTHDPSLLYRYHTLE